VIQFNGGGINTFGDSLLIYDGDNVGAPLLYAGNNNGNLGGIIAISTNPSGSLLLQAKSNAFTSCQSGGVTGAWNWDVICLDCTVPDVEFFVEADCQHRQFDIKVFLNGLGGSSTVDILNNGGATDLLGVGIGNYNVGPFAMDDSVQISLVHDNFLCSMVSPWYNFLFDSCVVISCGQDDYTYCYENNDDSWWLYESANSDVLTLNFTAGDMALGDIITIHNGRTENASVLYSGNNGGVLSGLSVVSNNADDALLVHFTSDGNLSCDDGFSPTPAAWSVQCSGIGIEEQLAREIEVYPNPSEGLFNIIIDINGQVRIQVKDIMGREVLYEEVSLNSGSSHAIYLGTLDNGPYFLEIESKEGRSIKKLIIQH